MTEQGTPAPGSPEPLSAADQPAPLVQPPPMAPTEPPVTWAPAPPPVAMPGGRTGLAAVAGVILLVLGILGGIVGLFVAIVGGSIASTFGDLVEVPGLEDPAGIFAGVVAFFGVLVVIYSAVYILAGVGVLRSRNWGRVLGLIVGILSGLLWLSSLGQSDRGGLPFAIAMLAAHGYIVVVLIMYWRTRSATA